MENFKYTEKLNKTYSEHLNACHLDSTVNISLIFIMYSVIYSRQIIRLEKWSVKCTGLIPF